jgi:Spy/CpxP family protein refolding chaperone
MPLSFQTNCCVRASKAYDEQKRVAIGRSARITKTKGVGKAMFLRKGILGLAGIIFATGMVALGQQPQTPSSPDGTLRRDRIERRERNRERMGREGLKGHDRMRRGGMGHLLSDLNLSDDQRQQSRVIMQRRIESTKAQREELFRLREKRIAGTFAAEDEARARVLHQEIRAAMEAGRTEIAGILTAEQKTRLEEQKKEHKTRIERRMKERQESLKNNPR